MGIGTTREPLRVLALGAHPDDIEIGAGGLILRLIEEGRIAGLEWVVFTSDPVREREARASAARFAEGAASLSVVVHAFRDGYLPYAGASVKDAMEALKAASPDVILTHRREDAHQDHRVISELAWATFRDHLILEYEVPKYDGDLGPANAYWELPESTARRKVDLILDGFPSQHHRAWFDPRTFWSIMRLRGIESNATEGVAEAFTTRKAVF